MGKDNYFYIYCVKYHQSLDDTKFFKHQEDAAKCAAADRVKYALSDEDQMLGVQPIKVWEQYNPEKYEHEEPTVTETPV